MPEPKRAIPAIPRPAVWTMTLGVLALACIGTYLFLVAIGAEGIAQKAVAITTGIALMIGTFLMTIALSCESVDTRERLQVAGGALSTAAGLMVVLYAVAFI